MFLYNNIVLLYAHFSTWTYSEFVYLYVDENLVYGMATKKEFEQCNYS